MGVIAVEQGKRRGGKRAADRAGGADKAAPLIMGKGFGHVEGKALDVDEAMRLHVAEHLPIDAGAVGMTPAWLMLKDQTLGGGGDAAREGNVHLIDDREQAAGAKNPLDLRRGDAAIEPMPTLGGGDGIESAVGEGETFRPRRNAGRVGAWRGGEERWTQIGGDDPAGSLAKGLREQLGARADIEDSLEGKTDAEASEAVEKLCWKWPAVGEVVCGGGGEIGAHGNSVDAVADSASVFTLPSGSRVNVLRSNR